MMRKLFNIQAILSLAFMFALFSCEYEQEVEAPISTDGYSIAIYETDFSGTSVTEGDMISYTVTIDKPLDVDLTFTVMLLDGTASEDDYVFTEAVIPAYSKESEMQITFLTDDVPEVTETIKLEIGIDDLARQYMLNPKTENPILELEIVNVNDPSGLTVGFGWEDPHNDIDWFSLFDDVDGLFPDYDNGFGQVSWALAGTSDNPEIILSYLDDPPGKYEFGIDPYHVEGNSVNYTISLGYPDQSVDFIQGVFDMTILDSYDQIYFDYWGIWIYHLLDVDISNDGEFTVTNLN